MVITHAEAEAKVDGQNIYWDRENIVLFDPTIDGYLKKNGIFRNGKWGIRYVVYMTVEGKYVIPRRYENIFI